MGSKLVGWAWDYIGPPPRKLVLLALAERALDDTGIAAGGSVPAIARRCGMSDRQTQRHLRALAPLVSFEPTTIQQRRGITPGPNRYRIHAPWVLGAAVLREDGPPRLRGCRHSTPACRRCA